jgi:DNA-binding MarR family transcriptional regulator
MQAVLRPPSGPTGSDAPEALVTSVKEVMGSLLRQLAPTLEEERLTMGQFWALHLVSALGRTSLTAVARHLSVAPPTVCGNVDALVRAGLLARARSERDRRSLELTLTAKGRRAETRIWRAVTDLMATATAEVRPEDLATAVRVFGEIRARLEPGAPLRGSA